MRRIEAVLDTVLEMREVFSEQWVAYHNDVPQWTPDWVSPESLTRRALSRKLEALFVPFTDELDAMTSVRTLRTTENWGKEILDRAINEVTELLKEAAT